MDRATQPPVDAKGVPPDTSVADASVDVGRSIAVLLIAAGHLTEQKLKHATRVQAKLATPKALTSILKELEFITDTQLRETLSANPGTFRVGDLLVELGHLQKSQLDAALALQISAFPKKRRLGDILIEHRFIDDRSLASVVSLQCGLPFVELRFSEIDKTLLTRESMRWCTEHAFFPIRKVDGRIHVVFGDPEDEKSRLLAEKQFGQNLLPAIATTSAIMSAVSFFERSIREIHSEPANDNSVVRVIEIMIADALRDGTSDIHIEPAADRLRIRFRCDGVLMPYKEFGKDVIPVLTSRLKIMAKADIAEKRRHQDGRILFEDPQMGTSMDMRASFFNTIHGENIVLRLLNKKSNLLDLRDIGMAPRMLERFRDDALDTPSGVMIITGPTGSGKTTTLYSCVNYLNDMETSIITAEDPVEYVIEGIAQCSINQKLNVTFEETLRHIVRQDPDVIVLGEIRDKFSAETAIQAALTGHKVLTTFHTEDSIGGLLRLLNMDIEAFLISSTVVCVVAQRLLRRVCVHCAEPYTPMPIDLRRLGYSADELRGITFKMGKGCADCRFTGYRGRVSVFELLILNETVKDALLARRTSYDIRRLSLETSGLVTLIEDGLVKAARGETSLQEVLLGLPRLHKPRSIHELQRLSGDSR